MSSRKLMETNLYLAMGYRTEKTKIRVNRELVDAVVVWDDETGIGKAFPPYDDGLLFLSVSEGIDHHLRMNTPERRESINKASESLSRYIKERLNYGT